MESFIGKVRVNEDWDSEAFRHYMEVISLSDSNDSLDERLIDYDGKIVKVTIEVLENPVG